MYTLNDDTVSLCLLGYNVSFMWKYEYRQYLYGHELAFSDELTEQIRHSQVNVLVNHKEVDASRWSTDFLGGSLERIRIEYIEQPRGGV